MAGRPWAGRIGYSGAAWVAAMVAVTALAFGLLRAADFLAAPLWVTLALLVVAGAASVGAFVLWGADATPRQVHCRTAVQVAGTTAVIYSTGWGPMLSLGYLIVAQEAVSESGPRAARPMLAWSVAGVVAGQLSIAAAIAPTVVEERFAHALAVLGLAGVAMGISRIRSVAAERELAEAALREREGHFRSLVQHAYDVTVVLDGQGRVTYVSPSAEHVFGYPPGEFVGGVGRSFMHPDDVERVGHVFGEVVADSSAVRTLEVRGQHRDGRARWLEVTLTNLLDDPNVRGIVANLHDVTDRRTRDEQLRHRAYHDLLTGLPNRAALLERLQQAVARAGRAGHSLAVLFVDLDGFKVANDTFGHRAGDELLVDVAKRLATCTRPEDTLARFGGDEFAVLLDDVETTAAARVAERVLGALKEPFAVSGRELPITASIGIALGAAGAEPADELLRRADVALYHAKELGRSKWTFYDGATERRVLERLEIESSIRHAVARGQLALVYQPAVDLRTGHIEAFEALVRWRHPRRGMLAPDAFIPQAEESEAILAIDRAVLEEACRTARSWASRPTPSGTVRISVNISPRWLTGPDVVEAVASTLRATGLDPALLELEITERMPIVDPHLIAGTLGVLRDLGVRLALDDFGSGYSSLAYLRHFPVNAVKIDNTLVARLGSSPRDAAIVASTIGLAHGLGIRVVAEGVEHVEQLTALVRLNCDAVQGHYFSPALDAPEATALLQHEHHPNWDRLPATGTTRT